MGVYALTSLTQLPSQDLARPLVKNLGPSPKSMSSHRHCPLSLWNLKGLTQTLWPCLPLTWSLENQPAPRSANNSAGSLLSLSRPLNWELTGKPIPGLLSFSFRSYYVRLLLPSHFKYWKASVLGQKELRRESGSGVLRKWDAALFWASVSHLCSGSLLLRKFQ